MTTLEQQFEQARRLFKSFHEREPDIKAGEIISVGGLVVPTVALEVGRLDAVMYEAIGDGKLYKHDFTRNRSPRLYSNAAANQLYILGGIYRFSDRGILR